MDLLPFERSTALWQRAAYLQRRLEQLVGRAPPGSLDPADVGAVTELLWAFRARSARRSTASLPASAWGRRPRWTRCSSPRQSRPSSSLPATRSALDIALGDDPVERALARRVPLRGCRHLFTAAAPRSSAISSPGVSSSSGTTADGGGRARAVRPRHPRRRPRPRAVRRSIPHWPTWAGSTPSTPTRRRRSRSSSRPRRGTTSRRPRLTGCFIRGLGLEDEDRPGRRPPRPAEPEPPGRAMRDDRARPGAGTVALASPTGPSSS